MEIPELRRGSCHLAIPEPRRRSDEVLRAVAIEADGNGVSTRGRDQLAGAHGIDEGNAESPVRRVRGGPDSTFSCRRLDHHGASNELLDVDNVDVRGEMPSFWRDTRRGGSSHSERLLPLTQVG